MSSYKHAFMMHYAIISPLSFWFQSHNSDCTTHSHATHLFGFNTYYYIIDMYSKRQKAMDIKSNIELAQSVGGACMHCNMEVVIALLCVLVSDECQHQQADKHTWRQLLHIQASVL